MGTNDRGEGVFEIAEPMFLASWQHGYAVGPSDHQLFLTINPEWQNDLLHCPVRDLRGDYTQVKQLPTTGVPTDSPPGIVLRFPHRQDLGPKVVHSQVFGSASVKLKFSRCVGRQLRE